MHKLTDCTFAATAFQVGRHKFFSISFLVLYDSQRPTQEELVN